MSDLDATTNHLIERFLPGYIERHREEILDAIAAAARRDLVCGSSGQVIWGALTVLNMLAGITPIESTETPSGASCGQDGLPQGGEDYGDDR